MKIRVRIVVLVTVALLITALAVVPRIIEAARSTAAAANTSAAADPVQGRRPEITGRRLHSQRHVDSAARDEAEADGFSSRT